MAAATASLPDRHQAKHPGGGDTRRVALDAGGPDLRGHQIHAAHWTGRGKGPAVVLVHGLAGSHLHWSHLAPLLADRLATSALWAPDLPGFGRTPPLPGRGTVSAHVRALDAFLATVSPHQACLVAGSSMGGLLSLLLASRHPARVDGLVLLAPAGPFPPGHLPDRQLLLQVAVAATPLLGPWIATKWLRTLDPASYVDSSLRLCGIDPDRFADPHRQARIDLVAERRGMGHAPRALVDASRSLVAYVVGPAKTQVWQAADSVTAPVLLLHGGRDRLVPLDASLRLAARRPDWTLRIRPAHGHTPMMDAAEVIADDIAAWRESQPPPSTRSA